MSDISAVMAIVGYKYADSVRRIYNESGSHFHIAAIGQGTADSEMLKLIGLGDNKKFIFVGLMVNSHIRELYERLEREMCLTRAGAGIAFSIPVDRFSAAVTKIYESQTAEGGAMDGELNDGTFELIITIVERGSFESVKNAAKAEGARGGTLIHGLGIGGEEAAKFLGISMQPEKDIVLIVVERNDAKTVMGRIVKEAGLSTPDHGICFSIPVNNALGLAAKVMYN